MFIIIQRECSKEIIASQDKIDVLINNAGITKDQLFLRMKEL